MRKRFDRACALVKMTLAMGLASLFVVTSPFSAGAVPVIENSDSLVTLTDLEDAEVLPETDFDAPESDLDVLDDSSNDISEPSVDPELVDPELEVPAESLLSETADLLNSFSAALVGEIPFTLNETHIAWEVKNGDEYVGGTTVTVSGPRSGWFFVGWGTSWDVVDCVAADVTGCADSLDKDPNPGKFAITQRQVGTQTGYQAITHGSVFRIRPSTANVPAGFEWANTDWVHMSNSTNTMPTSQWPTNQPGYMFPNALQMTTGPAVSWSVEQSGMPVGGAIVQLATSSSGTGAVRVQDCVEAPCSPLLMDLDPEPGKFKVSTIYRVGSTGGFETSPVSRTTTYYATPIDAPVGYSWVNSNAITTSGTAAGTRDMGVFSLTTSSTMSWSVLDGSGNPVGNATVKVEGPRVSNSNWSSEYYVTDCTTAPCHPESMDQDPRPGYFKLDTLRGLNGSTHTIVQVNSNSRYRITPMGSMVGYSWASTATRENQGFVNGNLAQPDLRVNARSTTSQVCVNPGTNYFTLARNSTQSAQTFIQTLSHNSAETSINAAASTMANSTITLPGGQTSNALGVTPTGVFYFTGQVGGGTNEQKRNTTVYRFDPSSDTAPYPVFNMDLLSPTTGTVVSGDATIYQGREEFYYAYYSTSPDLVNGQKGIRFHLYRYSHGNGDRTGEVRHVDVPRQSDFPDNEYNGDFSFDAQNNLQFIISDFSSRVVSGSVAVSDFQPTSSAHTLPDVTTVTGTSNYGTISSGAINGITYTANGRAIVQQTSGNSNSLVTLPNFNRQGARTFSSNTYVDLAGCAKPLTITVQKNLAGDRVEPDDQFQLSASRQSGTQTINFESATTTGTASGIQREQVGPFVATMDGTFRATETLVNANEENYTTTWACRVQDSEGNASAPFAQGEGRSLSFALTGAGVPAAVKPGSSLVCVFTNVPQREVLNISKTSTPESETAVNQGDVVDFHLNFDNTTGTLPARIDHRDYLKDVLDDADFVGSDGSISQLPNVSQTGGTLTTQWDAQGGFMHITGQIPVGQSIVVSYSVKVKPNSDDLEGRQNNENGNYGFYLQNYLARSDAELPDYCASGESEGIYCTTHPVNAWTVYKEARPASGARLHAGGNAHYRIVAEKLTPQTTIQDLVITDDLTNVFKSAGFDPDAAVPGGALARGVYFFDAEDNSLAATNDVNVNADITGNATNAVAAYAGEAGVPNPVQVDGRWLIQSAPIAVPKNAERVELWFAVEAGESNEFPGAWPTNGMGNEQAPVSGAKFTNFVTATASQNPAVCVTGQVLGDPNVQGIDPNFPLNCQVTHELQENYFTIRKDAQGPGVDQVNLNEFGGVSNSAYGFDTTGMWNMIGHQFEIRDNINGQPSANPSVKLCRTDYNPDNGWDGTTWTADVSGADWGEGSETLAAIKRWNNAHPEAEDQLPLCALIYEQGDTENLAASTAGGQTGRWRSENLTAGNYWLVETKAPTHQISTNGTQKRAVPGIQLLAEPVAFTVWPDAAGESPSAGGANYGLGQLDVSPSGSFDDWQDRCIPGNNVGDRPTACVNPTGYLFLVKDVTTISLPLAGGEGTAWLTFAGLVLLVLAGIGVFVWRRRE
ncbi:hypothetical protein CDES_11665 [Corynebacterium deserti GIMN1.010]|uniref:Gram-positive cocci surface proteins LPxTG domain-containing protein n=2 Tax=Corynebacterium TaxID=1716 RepID=A0A0M4CKX4_9CORY|nr:hypothetical protein CDES_11665 [Corynebacterium deserti GIMN1.010]